MSSQPSSRKGNTTSHTGTATTPLQYSGQYLDDETGFYYLRNRYYDPLTAQFLTIDPLVSQTRATYTYAGNNPINGTGPTGMGSGIYLTGTQGCGGADERPCSTHSSQRPPRSACSNPYRCSGLNSELNEDGPQGSGNDRTWNTSSGACSLRLGFLATCGDFATSDGSDDEEASGVSGGGASTPGSAFWEAMVRALDSTLDSRVSSAADKLPRSVPPGWSARIADDGQGVVFQRPGAVGNADMIRIMDATAKYPEGYIRIYNSYGQPVDVYGKPGPPADTHVPVGYRGPWPWWPGG